MVVGSTIDLSTNQGGYKQRERERESQWAERQRESHRGERQIERVRGKKIGK